MPVWVQALRSVNGETDGHGRIANYQPGDIFSVGRQRAQILESCGAVCIPAIFRQEYRESILGLQDTSIVLTNGGDLSALQARFPGAHITTGTAYALDSARTLFWDTAYNLRAELLPVGFYRLRNWQVVAPLYSYQRLARDLGTPDDRAKTEAVIHDLRVPVYDVRCLFIRRCSETEELLRLWQAETGDRLLAFMRALYQVKPILCALPLTWQR